MKDNSAPELARDEVHPRRTFLGVAGAASIAGLLPGQADAAGGKATKPVSGKIDPRTFTGPGIESESGTAIYRLPRDHAMHGGTWYQGAEYQETHYFTGFFTDKKTNKPYSLFYCWSVYGWNAKEGRPLWVALFALTDIERKKFVQAVHVMPGALTTKGSGANVPDKQFFAEYLLGKGPDGSEGLFSYRNDSEAWRWMSSVPTPRPKMPGDNKPYFMDARAHVAKPGYQCPVPYGFTQEGLGTDVTNNIANPFTGAGLSWYVIAPCMEMNARVKCDDMDLDLEGQVYYEHQWGRIRIPGMEQARYFWGWARLDSGEILNWRTYRDVKTGKYVPEDSANRFNVIYPDGRVQYFMGPAFTYQPTKAWKSPVTGVEYPVYGVITTPLGKFYCEPVVENAEAQLLNGGMWEGAARLRKDGPEGPVVGRSFCEHMWAPFDSAAGKDIPYDPKITGRRDGNLPAARDFRKFTSW